MRDAQAYIDGYAEELTHDELLEFLLWRKTQVGNSSLNATVCGLKYYYSHVRGEPERVVAIPTPRKPKQLGELLTVSELAQLFAAAASPKHRCVLALLFGLGLRAGEVAAIRLHDFDRAHRTLIVRKTKGGKSRTLPYDESLRRELIPYFRRENPADFLFVSSTRQRHEKDGMSIRGIQYIVAQTRQRAGLTKHVCPHTLRHCFAVHYLNTGGNLVRLQQLLGHKYLTTTLRYLSYATPELKDIPSPLSLISHA